MLNKNYFSLLFILIYSLFNSQSIKGKISDEDRYPASYSEVVLSDTSKKKHITVTKDNGEYEVKLPNNGTYLLEVLQQGELVYKKEVSITNTTLLDIVLPYGKTKQIEEITLTGKKKLIELKVDRLVFNVENSIVSQGVDAMEVLRNTPKIDVSRGGIQLIGKSRLGIMINGRLLNLSGSDLENYLKSMRSDNISKVEVITTPPAKYDAEGNSGLINIILKKNSIIGWKGSVSGSYIQRTYPGVIPSTSLFYTSNKLNLSFNLSGDWEAKKSISSNKIDFLSNYRKSFDEKKETYKGGTTGLSLNYSINDNNDIGILYNGNLLESRQTGTMNSYYLAKPSNIINSTQHSPYFNKTKYHYNSLSAYYDLKIDTLGKKMSIYVNYLHKNNNANRDFSTENYLGSGQIIQSINSAKYDSKADYNVYSVNSDFTLPFEFATIETGIKYASIDNNSTVFYYDIFNNSSVIDLNKSNKFEYNEDIFALYFSMTKEISEKWEAQIGLRYENTSTKGYSKTLNQRQTHSFDNFFPSAYLIFNPNEDNSLSLTYSKRIDRPGFYEVNPFRVYTDFYSYDSGNPYLLPSYTHNLEFSYLYKNNLSLSLYGSRITQGKDYITTASSGSNVVISQPMNYYNQNTLGLDVSYTYKPFKCLNSYNNVSTYYNDSDSYMSQITIPSFKGFGAFLSTRNTLVLNKNKTSYFVLNFFQSLPTKESFVKSFNRASLDLGLRFLFFNNDLQANVMVNDLFSQNRNRVVENYPQYNYSSKIYNDMRNVTVSMSYRFGNNKLKTNNKRIENSEKNRL